MIDSFAKKEKIAEFLHAGLPLKRLLALETHEKFLQEEYAKLQAVKKLIVECPYLPADVSLLIGSYLPWFNSV